MNIVKELIGALEKLVDVASLKVEDVRIGIFYSAAKLSEGQAGVAFTPRDLADTVCCPRSAARMPASGKLTGKSARELLHYALSDNSLKRSVGIAVANALSAGIMKKHGVSGGRVLKNADALDVVEMRQQDRVAMVGAFIPFIRKLKDRVSELYVVDKHPQALRADEMHLWRPPEEVGKVLPRADIIIITGSAMVEGGLDELLTFCRKAREVVLAGPTASMWPLPFFQRGVTVMGGIFIHDADRLLQVVSEGGSGYFFTGPARKMAIIRE